MALDESNGIQATMPVMPGYGSGGNNMFGDNGWWIILLFILLGGWGNGFGGNGGMNNLYPWMNNSQNINDGFRDQFLNTQVMGLQNGQNALQNSLTQQGMMLQNQLAQCCCDNRQAVSDLRYNMAMENSNIRQEIAATKQAVLDQLCADKLEAKNDLIAQLRSELLYARGQASQDVQTATIQAGQRALATEVEQYVNPTARPAYIVQNPNCCPQNNCGCGCGGM